MSPEADTPAVARPEDYRPLSDANIPVEGVRSLEAKTAGTVMADVELGDYLDSTETPAEFKGTIENVLRLERSNREVLPVPGGVREIFSGGIHAVNENPKALSAVRTAILTAMERKGMVTPEADDANKQSIKGRRLILDRGERTYPEEASLPKPLVEQWSEVEPEVSFHHGGGLHTIRRVLENPYGAKVTETLSYDTNERLIDIKYLYEQQDRHPDFRG